MEMGEGLFLYGERKKRFKGSHFDNRIRKETERSSDRAHLIYYTEISHPA